MENRIKKGMTCATIAFDHLISQEALPQNEPFKAGDVALFEVLEIGKHTQIQSLGRNLTITPGDRVLGVFGARYATNQFEGYVPDTLQETSNGGDVLFLFGQGFIHLGNVLIGQLLDGVLQVAGLILGDVTAFLLLLGKIHAIAADIANRHPALFSVLARQLDKFLAALRREGRNVEPDHLAVIVGGEPDIGQGNGLFD